MPNTRSQKREREAVGQPPMKRFKHDFLDTISVLVGPDETPFTIHKDLICSKSPFFEAACSSAWSEGQQGVIRLPSKEPMMFTLYVNWVYSGAINLDLLEYPDQCPHPNLNPCTKQTICRATVQCEKLCTLYVVADSFLDTGCQDAIVDAVLELIDEGECRYRFDYIAYICEHARNPCGLRACFASLTAVLLQEEDMHEFAQQLPHDFVVEVAAKLCGLRRTNIPYAIPSLKNKCHYHDHGPEFECGSSVFE